MKVLFVTVNREHRVAFNIFSPLQKELSVLCDVDIYQKQVGTHGRKYQQEFFNNPQGYNKEFDIDNINNTYDVVITDSLFAFMGEDWSKISIPKLTLIEDQHNQCMDIVKIAETIHKFDYFLVRYRDAFYNNHPTIDKSKIFWFPHSINTEFFKDYNEIKTISFLTTGSIGSQVYPLRDKVYNELKDHPQYRRVQRPIEGSNDKWPIGHDYARLINQSIMSFTCTSIYGYPLMKTFEIPACNSILCCDYSSELKDLGFVPNFNMLGLDMNTNIREFVEWHMYNSDINHISKMGYDLIQERHTVKIRAQQLCDLLRNII